MCILLQAQVRLGPLAIGHQGGGVLASGSDGGYINGVAMFALQTLMLFAVDNDLPTTLPPRFL